MKIIDSFIFYNEIDMLKYRLSILDPYVDFFVLVEAKYTFSGKEKELFYENNKSLFEKFNHKIIHIIVDDFPYKYPHINYQRKEQWSNEYFHRNQIARGIDTISFENEDVIITSDLDEIIDPTVLKKIKNGELDFNRHTLNRVQMDMYYYNLNTLIGSGTWHGIKVLTYQAYKNIHLTFQDMRTYEWTHDVPVIPKGGWHLSYFGDIEFIKNKIQHFAHQEFNNSKYVNNEFIREHIEQKKDMFSENKTFEYIPTKDNPYLPPEYDVYLNKYYLE
jgi:beta-1,4-mannosyl-glycoprotein beta-1,4-N-acetylglucosaminyltransferase